MRVSAPIRTMGNRAARRASTGDRTIGADRGAARFRLSVRNNIPIGAFHDRAARFASACRRAIGTDHCTSFTRLTVRYRRAVGSRINMARCFFATASRSIWPSRQTGPLACAAFERGESPRAACVLTAEVVPARGRETTISRQT